MKLPTKLLKGLLAFVGKHKGRRLVVNALQVDAKRGHISGTDGRCLARITPNTKAKGKRKMVLVDADPLRLAVRAADKRRDNIEFDSEPAEGGAMPWRFDTTGMSGSAEVIDGRPPELDAAIPGLDTMTVIGMDARFLKRVCELAIINDSARRDDTVCLRMAFNANYRSGPMRFEHKDAGPDGHAITMVVMPITLPEYK